MSINPDAPDPREEHLKEWELMCSAQNIIRAVMAAYVQTATEEGLPVYCSELTEAMTGILESYTGFNNNWSMDNLGEGFLLTYELIEEISNE